MGVTVCGTIAGPLFCFKSVTKQDTQRMSAQIMYRMHIASPRLTPRSACNMISRQTQQYVKLHVDNTDTQEKTTYGRQATIALPQARFSLCKGHQACRESSIAKVGRLVMILDFPSHQKLIV